jgi:hypothetical protein
MYQYLFVWLFNDCQQQQSARNDILESISVFGITLHCRTLADSGTPLYKNHPFPQNQDGTFAFCRARNNLFDPAHQSLAPFFLYKLGNEAVF